VELDAVTQYSYCTRSSFGWRRRPPGHASCMRRVRKDGTELKVVWNIIEQGGSQKKVVRAKNAEKKTKETRAEQRKRGSSYAVGKSGGGRTARRAA